MALHITISPETGSSGKDAYIKGSFFEKLVTRIIESEGYKVSGDVQFTGSELDLMCVHQTRRKDSLLVECKAKKSVSSGDIKSFLYDILTERRAKHGYFISTYPLQKQAAGLAKDHEKNKRLTFLGPDHVIGKGAEIGLFVLPAPLDHLNRDGRDLVLYIAASRIIWIVKTLTGATGSTFELLNAKTGARLKLRDIDVKTRSAIIRDECLNDADEQSKIQLGIFGNDNPINFISDSYRRRYIEVELRMEYNESTYVKTNVYKRNDSYGSSSNVTASSLEVKQLTANKVNLIIGRQKSGKSVLLYELSKVMNSAGKHPIFIRAQDINSTFAAKIGKGSLTDLISTQYDISPLIAGGIDRSSCVLLIDDLHRDIEANARTIKTLLKTSEEANITVVATCDNIEYIRLTRLIQGGIDAIRTESIDEWECLPIGRGQIEELCELYLATTHRITGNTSAPKQYLELDSTVKIIRQLIGSNILSPFPFHVISALSVMMTGSPINSTFTIHGSYYETIIKQTLLDQLTDSSEVSMYYAIMDKVCSYLLGCDKPSFNRVELEKIIKGHLDFIGDSRKPASIVNMLIKSRYLNVGDEIEFYHPYVYYYFASRSIAQSLDTQVCPESVYSQTGIQIYTDMLTRSYVEEYANVALFMPHLTDDSRILKGVYSVGKSLLQWNGDHDFEDLVSSIQLMSKELPEEVLRLSSPSNQTAERKKKRQISDAEDASHYANKIAEGYRGFKSVSDLVGLEATIAEEPTDIVSFLVRCVKHIDVIGNYLRAYWGITSGKHKQDLLSLAFDIGSKALEVYFSELIIAKEEIVDFTFSEFEELDVQTEKKKLHLVKSIVNHYIYGFALFSVYGVSQRLSHSLGTPRIKKAVDDLNPSGTLEHLFKYSVRQSMNSKIDIDLLRITFSALKAAPLMVAALRRVVFVHSNKYAQDRTTREELERLLNISMQSQLKIVGNATPTIVNI